MKIVFPQLIQKADWFYFFNALLMVLLPLRAISETGSNLKVLQSDRNSITFQIDVPPVNFKSKSIDNKQYVMPSITGYILSMEPGQPALPQRAFTFGVPPNARVHFQLLNAVERVESRQTGGRIAPAPSERSLDSGKQNQLKPEFIEGSIYSRQTWFPEQLVQLNDLGTIRDQRIVSLKVSPLQFNPSQNEIRVYGALTIRLTFEQSAATATTLSSVDLRPSQNAVVPFESVLQKSLINYAQAKAWRTSRFPKTSTASSFFDPTLEYYKMTVESDGIYQITGQALQNAGIDIHTIPPATIKIYNKGKEIPIKIADRKDDQFDPEDWILFYGQFNQGEKTYLSPYSKTNAYWLTWGGEKGLRLAEADGGLFESDPAKFIQPANFRAKQHFEQDWSFDRLLLVTDEQADHWFWQRMDAFKTYQFNIQLQKPDSLGNFAKVRVALHGSTHPAVNPDHHVIALINGYVIGEALWDGQREFIIENQQIPADFLHHGENLLELKLPGDTQAGEVDQVFLNWLEVEYDRKFQAVDDYLEIQWQGTGLAQFTVAGFSAPDVQIFDQYGRNITNYEVTRSGFYFSVTFQESSQASPNRYFLFTPEVYKQPVTITKHEVSTLKSKQNGADYVIITHSDFKDALQPLAQQRVSKGLRVKMVAVQEIYDEFNDGIYDPRAIKAFLKYAYINWMPPAPTYVLLVGDTHFGFDKEVAHSWGKTSFVPTYMAYTVSWGATSSDNFFVTVSGEDPLPDMFIGRLPVNSVEETTAIVNKILNYENHPNFGEWRRKLALSVGNREFFEQQADNLDAELIPEDFDVPRLYTNPHSPYFGSTEELVDIFNQGAAILNFIGHGGGGVFFDSELFLLEDIVLLDNAERLPVALSWSCFIGYFDNPWTPSLGEELLRVPDRGVVAHFGSAGRAWLYGDSFFNQALFTSLFRRNHRILGQVTTEAKMELLSNSGIYRDMVENYVLLGDPALKIGFPEKQISIQIQNPAIVEGDTLRISGSLEEPLNGSVKLSFYNERDSLITSQEFTVTQGQFNATHAIQNFPHGPYKVKAYFWNASTDGSGVSFFTVNRLHFSEVRFIPAKPTHLDTVHFFTKFTRNSLFDSLQVEAVNCQWSWDRTNWNSLMMSPFEDGYKSEIPISVLEGRTLFYKFVAIIDHTSASRPDTLFSRLFSYYIPKRADLTLSKKRVTVGGSEEVLLYLQVDNKGETDAVQVPITIYELSDNPPVKTRLFQKVLPVMRAKRDTVLSLIWPDDKVGLRQMEIVLDDEDQIDETSEFNNSVQLQFRFLTRSNGTGGPAFSADSNFVVTIPPNSMNQNTTFSLKPVSSQELSFSESGLGLVSLLSGATMSYAFTLADSNVVFEKKFKIAFKVDLHDSLTAAVFNNSNVSIYWYQIATHSWIPLNASINLEKSEVSSDEAFAAGTYGLFLVKDNQPPVISVKVNGQWFTDGDYVASNPEFSVVITDSSGISLSDNSLQLFLDNAFISKELYSFGFAGQRPTTILLNYSPDLSSGSHSFAIRAKDVPGNLSESAIRFEVSSDFQLLSIANHPNPFTDETIIAYTLTNEAETTEIKIYTVVGQLIRSFEYYNEVGYVEHVWDGSDDFGNEIANGVYYMRFVAKQGSERIERIEKMAKVR